MSVYIASYVFRESEKCCFCAIVLSIASLCRIQYLFGHEVFLYLIVNDLLQNLGEKTQQCNGKKVRTGGWCCRFLRATSRDSLQGSGKIPDVKEVLMFHASMEPERVEP